MCLDTEHVYRFYLISHHFLMTSITAVLPKLLTCCLVIVFVPLIAYLHCLNSKRMLLGDWEFVELFISRMNVLKTTRKLSVFHLLPLFLWILEIKSCDHIPFEDCLFRKMLSCRLLHHLNMQKEATIVEI